MSIRERFECALSGEPVEKPVFAVYDWFVNNRAIDWQSLFEKGLGQINHVDVVEFERPNAEIIETKSEEGGRVRTDIRLVTDRGELHEYYLDNWQQEYLIKSPADYRIVTHAFSDAVFKPNDTHFERSEAELGDRGITLGHLGWTKWENRRTPFQAIQIDFTGLERFSVDILDEEPGLMELIELMNEQTVEVFKTVLNTRVRQIKLWENLTIETMGPALFRRYLVPLYEKISEVLDGSDKKVLVHFDGKLRVIADDIARLAFDGIDSLTPPPEGDLTIARARRIWTDKFFWLHPSLSWFHMPEKELIHNIRQMASDAGPSRYCMMISEEVPPDWERTMPLVLNTLDSLM